LNLDLLLCPGCGAGPLTQVPEALLCRECGGRFPVIEGVPLLVRDLLDHEAGLERARDLRPAFNLEPQPPEEASPWKHHLRKRRLFVRRAIAAQLSRSGKERAETLLDLGCGDGNHLSYLAPLTRSLWASDHDLRRLLRAQKRAPGADLFLADIFNYPVLPDSFEVVFCNHVLEHLEKDGQALGVIHRILKPGGLLVLGVPNEGAGWWRLAYWLEPGVRRRTDHHHFYTAGSIGQKVRRTGFELLGIEHLGWGPPIWSLDARIRTFRLIDDLFELIGRRFFPGQSSSLYVLAVKPRAR